MASEDAPVERDVTPAMTQEAPPSRAPWTRLLGWESIRYSGSGWWIDAVLPHGPRSFLATAIALPVAVWALGLALASDSSAYLETHDATGQIPFLALHLVCLRMCATLYRRATDSALGGLGIGERERAPLVRGLFGVVPNVASVACAGYWIWRDTTVALIPDPATGLTAFTDPEQWDMAALGHPVHLLLVVLWNFEWLIFGFILWVQIWGLVGTSIAIRRTRFEEHVSRILIGNEYRDFFTLATKNATICFVFAIGNLWFIHYTGELFPRDPARVTDLASFFSEMSDLLSTGILFAVIVAAAVGHVMLVRRALTRAVNRLFAEAGDATLHEMQTPLSIEGVPVAEALERLSLRMRASEGLLRAIVFQREVDVLGTRGVGLLLLKAAVPLGTVIVRLTRMLR